MTIEDDALRQALRALMMSPEPELPDYSADPVVRRRVGGMLADVRTKSLPRPQKYRGRF